MFGKGEAMGDERAASIAQNIDRLWGELWQIPTIVFAWGKLLAFGTPIHSTPITETLGLSTSWWSVILALPRQRLVCSTTSLATLFWWSVVHSQQWKQWSESTLQTGSSLWGLATRSNPPVGMKATNGSVVPSCLVLCWVSWSKAQSWPRTMSWLWWMDACMMQRLPKLAWSRIASKATLSPEQSFLAWAGSRRRTLSGRGFCWSNMQQPDNMVAPQCESPSWDHLSMSVLWRALPRSWSLKHAAP